MGYGTSSGMLVRLANLRTTEMSTEEFDRLAQGVGDGWRAQGVGFLKAVQYNFMTKVQNPMYFGASGAGVDVTFWGTTAAAKCLWDESGDEMIFDGADLWLKDSDQLEFGDSSDVIMEWTSTGAFAVQSAAAASSLLLGADAKLFNTTLKGALTVGKSGTGHDVIFYGTTAASVLTWDESEDEVFLDGADLWLKDSDQLEFGDSSDVVMEWTSTGAFAVQSAAASSSLLLGATSKVFNTTLKGTLAVGANTEGYDVTFYGTGSGATLLYDKSADELVITGGALKIATAGEYLKMTNTTGTVSFQLDTTSTGLVVR